MSRPDRDNQPDGEQTRRHTRPSSRRAASHLKDCPVGRLSVTSKVPDSGHQVERLEAIPTGRQVGILPEYELRPIPTPNTLN